MHKCVDNSLQSLSAIWHDIGLSEEAQCERTKAVLDHIQGLLEEMNTEEEDCRTKLKEGVRTLQLDYAKLCSQMSVSEIQVWHIEFFELGTSNFHAPVQCI